MLLFVVLSSSVIICDVESVAASDGYKVGSDVPKDEEADVLMKEGSDVPFKEGSQVLIGEGSNVPTREEADDAGTVGCPEGTGDLLSLDDSSSVDSMVDKTVGSPVEINVTEMVGSSVGIIVSEISVSSLFS
eukprot:CAMPEP_0182420290 /NCGR_PEP_ID=MMETSP1167-20130531/4988_1 /TAXON_ID=2988 /ORGANISM="Mallomonas Sp, Strain CCMP3275" /LENGTH=131 /DNA_ID=CAMNT_0024596067 /DNA_START=465 /DNA_END=860 /DNA_ORIENTATION=-